MRGKFVFALAGGPFVDDRAWDGRLYRPRGRSLQCSVMERVDPTIAAAKRLHMVETQLRRRGICSPRVLAAMEAVPRHEFVPVTEQADAYADCPLSIGHGQTISQPYIVAAMTELLDTQSGDSVLEVGTGSGYQAAILANLGAHVTSFEWVPELAEAARLTFERLGIDTVTVVPADGTCGLPGRSFECIIVTAGAGIVPTSLIDKLADGGRLVMPRGTRWHQMLTLIRRSGTAFEEEVHEACVFVPLRGQFGWDV